MLEENKIYYIKHIKQVRQAQRTTYIIYLFNDDTTPIYLIPRDPPDLKPYKSNYFIEQQLNKIDNINQLDGQGIKSIQAGPVKRTPNKNDVE